MSKKNEKNEVVSVQDIDKLLGDSVELIRYARSLAARQVNIIQLLTYYTLGKWIVDVEQGGDNRAEYGKRVLKGLSDRLNKEFEKGFSMTNLEYARKFYRTYKDRIPQTLFEKFAIKKSQTVFGELEKKLPFTLPCLIIFSL